MREYSILQRHSKGKSFIIHNFKDVNSAKQKLFEIIHIEEERGRPYFVDNDFFDNKYAFCSDLYYLRLIFREVSEWQPYNEYEHKKLKQDDEKIIFVNFYKKA